MTPEYKKRQLSLKKQYKAAAAAEQATKDAQLRKVQSMRWKVIADYLSTASPHELHLFVRNSNFDCNRDEIRLLIDNPRLDLGTAVLLFWKLGGDYIARHAPGTVPDFAQETEVQIERLNDRCSNGFYANASISVAPHRLPMHPGEYETLGPVARQISPVLYQSIEGTVPLVGANEDFDDGLPSHIHEQLNAIMANSGSSDA
jgi:hypothetical protein